MKKQRYLPFGYQIQDGKIVVHPAEGKLVPDIFISYLNGNTLQAIANKLQQTGIPYSETSTIWSKHMVRRILENPKYCGKDDFPALTDQKIFEQALRLRQQKAPKPLPHIELIRKYMTCANCRSKLRIDLGTRNKVFWKCDTCELRIGPIPNTKLVDTVLYQMNALIQNPDIFQNPIAHHHHLPIQIGKIPQDIQRLMEQPSTAPEEIISLIFERAQLQYECLEPIQYDPATLKLQQLYSSRSILEQIDETLFSESVQNILLSPAETIQLCFINKQIYPPKDGELLCHKKQ